MVWRLSLMPLILVRRLYEPQWYMAKCVSRCLLLSSITYWDGHESVKFEDGLLCSAYVSGR